jgi:hypothetical protein
VHQFFQVLLAVARSDSSRRLPSKFLDSADCSLHDADKNDLRDRHLRDTIISKCVGKTHKSTKSCYFMNDITQKLLDKPAEIAFKTFELISKNKDSTILRYLVIIFSVLSPYCIFSIFPNTIAANSLWSIFKMVVATSGPLIFASVAVYVATEAMRRQPDDHLEHHNEREQKILNAELLTVSLLSGYLSFFGAYFVAYAAWWMSGLFHSPFNASWVIPLTYFGYTAQMVLLFCKYYLRYKPKLS